jgi:uncharacterized protein (DUF4415 family)
MLDPCSTSRSGATPKSWISRHTTSTITLRVDDDVIDFFKHGGAGYQSRMNAVLRAYAYACRKRSKQGTE